ncbi:GntR family transcriptional regulator [Rhizosaccharibacter radicis]|uniref:GntR family transcriptional regulator n=1 Tax=Rhizosaccharibacter radicis TaxID=2782605 RepID=A0ABT1VVF2_9PROT|nr:GntR family transcriptional regulator [Acetobacteraceae bacterium KSS12]
MLSSPPAVQNGPPDGAVVLCDGERESLSQRAYKAIRGRLVSSMLRPGHKLVLRPLAAELGLSPTPVREALLRLVSENALELDDRGTAIVPILSHADFTELCGVRGDLELRAAAAAAERALPHEIDELERLNLRCLEAFRSGDKLTMLDNNTSFHRTVCQLARTRLVQRMLEGLWMRLGPAYALSADLAMPVIPAPEHHPHTLLINALRARDVEAARRAAQQDIDISDTWLGAALAEET